VGVGERRQAGAGSRRVDAAAAGVFGWTDMEWVRFPSFLSLLGFLVLLGLYTLCQVRCGTDPPTKYLSPSLLFSLFFSYHILPIFTYIF
jgi:hypothetical protein